MRSNSAKTFHLVLLFTLLCRTFAAAWGPDGHRIVADLAETHLTPKAKAAIDGLLDGKSMEDIANWPDEMRKDHPEWSNWHYVDIPYGAASYDSARDGDKGNNVIDKTVHFATVVADTHASKADRAEAVKFLVHFVGDIHQPMHCIDRGDRGGNARLVFYRDMPRAVNLHAVWDSTILKHILNGASDKVFAGSLDSRISKADAVKWSAGTPEAWASESHAIAQNDAYRNIPSDGPPPRLGEEYISHAESDVKDQLSKAGLRLASVLNHALSNSSK